MKEITTLSEALEEIEVLRETIGHQSKDIQDLFKENRKLKQQIIDVTGIELTQGDPTACAGEKKGCCDECNYYLKCYPEWEKFVFDGSAFRSKK